MNGVIISMNGVIISPLDVYGYLETHVVRVYDKSGREFMARARCNGYTRSSPNVAELQGMGNDGHHYHLVLSGMELQREIVRVDDSTVRVYDANGQRIYLEFYTRAHLHL